MDNDVASLASSEQQPTYEEIAVRIIDFLCANRVVADGRTVCWDGFIRLSEQVHSSFTVPSTTFSPMMRRLCYAIGQVSEAKQVVGAGTFVGYTFSWLLRDRLDPSQGPFCEQAVGLDLDDCATHQASDNVRHLHHAARVRFETIDAVRYLESRTTEIDLLYIDTDSPNEGKQSYRTIVETALKLGLLPTGAMILAHDPCVERFRQDFDSYHRVLQRSDRCLGPWVLPVDACGLSVAGVQ